MEILNNDIRKIEDLEDGSSVYEIGPEIPNVYNDDFDANIALSMPQSALKKLSSFLLEAIEKDLKSRENWLTSVEKVKTYLGFSLEDFEDGKYKDREFTRTFDSTLSTALIRFYATTRAELLPQSGPAGFKINGENFAELEKEGDYRRDRLNNYLTITDGGYYSDFEKFLLYLGLYGSGFKKVYFDKILNRPISRFISPIDFIVNADCTSILDSTRITHELHLSKREIILNQQNGIYRDVELKYLKGSGDSDNTDEGEIKDGIDIGAYKDGRSLSSIYEIHTYLNLDDFTNLSINNTELQVPLPYTVGVDKISTEILYIRRNWNPDDSERKAINYFVQYNYLPGFGIYGIGLAHLLGSSAINATTILRQLIDAGKFANLRAGLKVKGFAPQKNDITVGPGEWAEMDTAGLPLEQGLMLLPYPEPSQTLRELMLGIVDQMKELGSTSELGMLDSREDIAAGTAMAFVEINNRIQSSVLRSIHNSLGQELRLLDELLNMDSEISKEIEIIPASDPSVNSTLQRIMKADSMVQLAMQAPEIHYMTEVFRFNYEAKGLDKRDIDRILKPSPEEMEQEILPLDPISEYMNILLGKPVKAAIWQNHPAHILCLGVFSQRPEIQNKPEAMNALLALITEHQALQFLIEMQQLLGVELPPLDQLQDPQVQNSIALALAENLENSGATQIQQNGSSTPDPNAILMAEIEAKQAETAAKERIANTRAETDIFKAQLDFEKEKAKIESNEDIAQLKAETELLKQEYSNG